MAPFGVVGVAAAAGNGLGRVTRVSSDFPRRFVVRSVGWLKIGVHWVDGRSVPCLGHDCEACLSGDPRMMAYTAAYELGAAGEEAPVVLEAPLPAVLKMEAADQLQGGELWLGAVVELSRQGRGVRRPLGGKVLGRRSGELELVPLEAVTDVMCAVWKLPRFTSFATADEWKAAVVVRLRSQAGLDDAPDVSRAGLRVAR